jgi:2-polyprenyl-3-methyl-5-hydroxy-6-metoxy-1,4-benzoquinol methylase
MATFDERAKDWDTPDRIARAAELASTIRATVPLKRTDRLVDVGAGTGLLGLALIDDVGEVVLLDPSAGMIEVATAKLAEQSLTTVRAVRFDLMSDPPPGDPFDVAVSLLVLHHIADTAGALAAIRDLVRPGGWIALADLDTEDGTFHSEASEGIHHHGFDRRAVEGIAADVGFVDVSTRTAMILDEESRFAGYSVFLVTGRRG